MDLLTLVVWADAKGKSAEVLLSARWDPLWYARIVEHGYGFTLTAPDGRVLSDMAFFLLLPWLEKAVSGATPLTVPQAGLAVSAAASLRAAAGIFLGPGEQARPLAGAVVAPLGAAGYFLWVAHRTGSLFGYFRVQRGWGNGFDGSAAFAGFVGHLRAGPAFPAGPALVAGLALLGYAYYRGFALRIPLPVQACTAVVLTLARCASGYSGPKPRLPIPAFGVLVPPAVWLAARAPRTSAAVLATLTLTSATYGALWFTGSGPP